MQTRAGRYLFSEPSLEGTEAPWAAAGGAYSSDVVPCDPDNALRARSDIFTETDDGSLVIRADHSGSDTFFDVTGGEVVAKAA